MYRRVARFNNKNRVTTGRAPYVTFNCHCSEGVKSPGNAILSLATAEPSPPLYYSISVCAIDPAIKNCAVRIEKRYFKLKDGAASDDAVAALIPICELDISNPIRNKIETVLQVKFDFISGKIEDSRNPIEVKKQRRKKDAIEELPSPAPETDNNALYYVNFLSMFDTIINEISKCHYIIVESQMPINTEMVRMSQAIITYLMIKTKNVGPAYPMIIEIDPKIKSSVFKAPPMKKPELKKWASKKGLEILEENGDLATLEFIKSKTKKDDHGDVICYTSGWFKILETGGFFKPPI